MPVHHWTVDIKVPAAVSVDSVDDGVTYTQTGAHVRFVPNAAHATLEPGESYEITYCNSDSDSLLASAPVARSERCGGSPRLDPEAPGDTGVPTTAPIDAGSPPEDTDTPTAAPGTPKEDTGTPMEDAGTAPSDSGSPTADTGVPKADTGTAPGDTGVPAADTGVPATDTGTAPGDAGVPATDTGVPAPVTPPTPPATGTTSLSPLGKYVMTWYSFQDNTPVNSSLSGSGRVLHPFVSVAVPFRLLKAYGGKLSYGDQLYVEFLAGRTMPNGLKHTGWVQIDDFCGDSGDDSYCFQSVGGSKYPNVDLYLGDFTKAGMDSTCSGPGGSGQELTNVSTGAAGAAWVGDYGGRALGSGKCGDYGTAKSQQGSCWNYTPPASSVSECSSCTGSSCTSW